MSSILYRSDLKIWGFGITHPVFEEKTLNQFFAKRTLKETYTEERAQFLCALFQSGREGHLCMEKQDVPDLPPSILEEGKDLMPLKPVVRFQNYYYLQRNWVLETHILEQAKRLRRLKLCQTDDVKQFHAKCESLDLLDKQKWALKSAFENPFSLFCGGPGTGKTYTAVQFVKLLLASRVGEQYKVVLTAPTGKAASHLQTVLGATVEAMTLHRLLRIVPGENRLFSDWKIDADLVVADEASMIDVSLLAKLLESIGNGTRLLLIGDPDQLPPVEAGTIFREMADAFGVRLDQSMRSQNSSLNLMAEKINRGEWIGDDALLPWSFDFSLKDKLYEKIAPTFSWDEPDPIDALKRGAEFRVLAALRQGPFGSLALNEQIVQEMRRRIQPGQWWIIPILITQNTPSQDLYNGTCGCLIGKSRGSIDFFDANAYFPQKVPFKKLPPFESAFCLSIHKSQGSEFERVLALFPQGSENFGKEAVYTAITRAKKEIEIVADKATLKAMLAKHSLKTSGFTTRFSMEINAHPPL